MQYLHKRIREARNARGFSQKEMAEKLGISQPGYQQIESGKYPDMKISTLTQICDILGESADWLLDINTDSPGLATRFYIEIIDLICSYGEDESIDDKVVDMLINDINSLKESLDF